ncbi:MAG: DUF99 family protein [Candidatus Thermoplasmatota archaeon]
MKKEIRLLGVDDGPFKFQDQKAIVIGVVMRGGKYLECVLKEEVIIDGNDATQILQDMVRNTRHKKQLRAIMIDGAALGGFNIIDIKKIYKNTGIPIVTITRDKPDYDEIKKALKINFKDWKRRLELMQDGELLELETKHKPIYVKKIGLNEEETKEIINLSRIRGVLPEPIRVAHIIASGIKRGESYGKA